MDDFLKTILFSIHKSELLVFISNKLIHLLTVPTFFQFERILNMTVRGTKRGNGQSMVLPAEEEVITLFIF